MVRFVSFLCFSQLSHFLRFEDYVFTEFDKAEMAAIVYHVTNKHESDGARAYEQALELTNEKLKESSHLYWRLLRVLTLHSDELLRLNDVTLFNLLHGQQQTQPQQQINLMEGMDPPPELFPEN